MRFARSLWRRLCVSRADSRPLPTHDAVFNWFYLVINIGSLLAATVVVYIQENVSWRVGFAVPTVAMALAVLCFVCGSRRYRHARRTPDLREHRMVRSGRLWARRMRRRK